jgi:catechol 2,3-dioxygenase-like lactoylglutathione lyase family enzyme
MAVQLNHTIIWCRDHKVSSRFATDILGLPVPRRWGPFQIVEVANSVSLDYYETADPIAPQHYAFLVTETEFDEIFGRIQERGLTYWADPGRRVAGELNHNDGGRGVYWEDPDGHMLEIITRPYGSDG